MSLSIGYMVCGDQCVDYEITITDKQKLAEEIAFLIQGYCRQMAKIIQGLDAQFPEPDMALVKNLVNLLSTRKDSDEQMYKIDGWLFEMISWLALSEQHKQDSFRIYMPHSQPSMHGIDVLAITMNPDNSIDRIIITEDKCTENPRDTIRDLVFPELDQYEKGEKNNAIYQQLEAIVANDIFDRIQNDVRKNEHRRYRICITRNAYYDQQDKREKLFDNYKDHVSKDLERRSASSIRIDDLRNWMDDLCNEVKTILESNINHV